MREQNPDLSGAVLKARYELLRELGVESLGRVWAARDRQAGKLVQVKILTADPGARGVPVDTVRFRRFAREITASFMVTHPNTVEVLDYGDQDGLQYLVLEYLVARPLSDELAKQPGRLEVPRAAAIAAQVVNAIAAAHQEGIVHRALSPVNVLLLDNVDTAAAASPAGSTDAGDATLPVMDYVKVRDFGMSKLDPAEGDGDDGDGESDVEVTATGIRVGDAAYMSPEYVASGVFHPKGDLYATGVLLFQMIAGRTPFQGDGQALLDAQVSAAPPRLRDLAPDVPEWMDALVDDLLSKDPDARPGVHSVIARLEDGVEQRLVVPALLPLDADGAFVRPVLPVEAGSTVPYKVLGVVALGLVGLAGAVAVLAAGAVVAMVLTAE